MAAAGLNTAFEEAIKVTPISSHRYSANMRNEWAIGTVPHGGYTTAVLYRLTTTHFAHTHPNRYDSPATPISIQLSFIRRTAVGPAVLDVEDIKLGARTSTIHVKLLQPREKKNTTIGQVEEELEVKVAGYITVSPPTAEVGVTTTTGLHIHPPTHPGTGPEGKVNLEKLDRTGRDGDWERIVMPFPEFRRATQQIELFGPDEKSRKPQLVDQWARFQPGGDKNGRWTNEALAYLSDVFPLALDGLDSISTAAVTGSSPDSSDVAQKKKSAKFWYPTVTLNIELTKRLPAEGVEWLYSRVQTRVVRNGRTEIGAMIFDEAGEAVAFSTQVGLVVNASRNVGKRSML